MTMLTNNKTLNRHNRGFTLIEVLVALLILAVGILGIAALQYQGLKFSHDAYIRSQVNVLAYDIADRMRMNRASASNYVDGLYTVPPVNQETNVCNEAGATTAGNDMGCWHNLVDRALPAGSKANVTVDAGDANRYTVTLTWADRSGGANHVVTYTFQIIPL